MLLKRSMNRYPEPALWSLGLIFLFFIDPTRETITFCLFKWAGFNSCMGCGIGRSIHYALHLQLGQSLNTHFFGIPATVILIYRVFKLCFTSKHKYHHEPTTNADDVTWTAAR